MARDKEAGTGKGIRVDVRRRGDGVVISIIGELHVGASEELRSALATAVSERLSVIVLDLGDMHFIGSEGLGIIVGAQIRCRHHGGVIRLARPDEETRHILARSRLDRLFPPFDSEEEAFRA